MIDTIIDWYVADFVRIYAFKAANIKSILIWVRPPLMMRINTAFGTKKVLSCERVELVQG